MLRFSMDKHKVTIDPMSLTLEGIRDIWDADKSKAKENAIKLLSYIHICAQIDPNAPFYKSSPDEVSSLAKREIYGSYDYTFKGEFDEEHLDTVIFDYRRAFESPEQAAARVIDKKIHQINSTLESTDIVIKEVVIKGVTQFVSNFTIINKMIQDLGKINAAKQGLMNIVKGQQAQTMKGEKEMSYLEKKRSELLKAVKAKEELDSPPGDDEDEEEDDENF